MPYRSQALFRKIADKGGVGRVELTGLTFPVITLRRHVFDSFLEVSQGDIKPWSEKVEGWKRLLGERRASSSLSGLPASVMLQVDFKRCP